MFYPEDSLKRGGRFYLCWVADSWPLRFATITHRQLWSQDIRRICEDLLEVMTNESGRPTQRFSLRLSSQLLRGLVRLYQRKVNVLLGDLCMINSYVIKHANKKWTVHEVKPVRQVKRPVQPMIVQEIVQEQPETEQRIEEMIQASGNAVANIQDITLREPQLPPDNLLLKPNDGFGEENPDQAIQLLQDRTIEMMLVNAEVSGVPGDSALGIALDTTDKSYDKSHDKSRLRVKDPQMERISEHDLTMFRKSTVAEEIMPQFEKDIPEIPEIPPPELPVPPPEKPQEELIPAQPTVVVEEPIQQRPIEPAPVPVEIELEELEVEPQSRRRRMRHRLIIDKKIKISAQHFRARIENPFVELRCENSYEDVICIRVPPELYFHRPCHGGSGVFSNIGFEISRLFSRNLGVVSVQPRAERELEEVMQRLDRNALRTVLERIEEEQDVPIVPIGPQAMLEQTTAEINVTSDILNVTAVPRVSALEQMEVDIAEMATQKVETLSQARKRRAETETVISPKRQLSVSYVSFRESQRAKEASRQIAEDQEGDKENRPDNLPPLIQEQPLIERNIEPVIHPVTVQDTVIDDPSRKQDAEQIVSSMLQEAGLADIQIPPPLPIESEVQISQRAVSRSKSAKGTRSGSETPLGSLDRTKVSLGDSEQTTDSKRFIRDQWGTEGTMLKILKFVKTGRQPVNINSLITKGPVIPGYKRIIAARCFTSILKLKQHGFVCVDKDPDTLEISNINLGPKLRNSQE